MIYVETALIIVSVGILLFILHICTCMTKWRQYIQDLEETDNNPKKTPVCVLHKNCSATANDPPQYSKTATCVIDIDLPPKYEEAMKDSSPENTHEQILTVQALPQVHIISNVKSTEQQQTRIA